MKLMESYGHKKMESFFYQQKNIYWLKTYISYEITSIDMKEEKDEQSTMLVSDEHSSHTTTKSHPIYKPAAATPYVQSLISCSL